MTGILTSVSGPRHSPFPSPRVGNGHQFASAHQDFREDPSRHGTAKLRRPTGDTYATSNDAVRGLRCCRFCRGAPPGTGQVAQQAHYLHRAFRRRGTTDILARLVTTKAATSLGTSFVIENKPVAERERRGPCAPIPAQEREPQLVSSARRWPSPQLPSCRIADLRVLPCATSRGLVPAAPRWGRDRCHIVRCQRLPVFGTAQANFASHATSIA